MKKILYILLAALIFVSCSKPDDRSDNDYLEEFEEGMDKLLTDITDQSLADKGSIAGNEDENTEDTELGKLESDYSTEAGDISESKMLTLVYEPDGITPTEQQLSDLVDIMQQRLNAYFDLVKIKKDGSRIKIGIPDTEEAKEILVKLMAVGDFRIQDETGNIILTNEHVMDATARKTDYTGMVNYSVNMTFTEEGTVLFKEATEQNIGKSLAIYVDDQLMISATVIQAITDGKCTLTTVESMEEAEYLATILRYGRLPFKLNQTE